MSTFDDVNSVLIEGVLLRDAEVKQTATNKMLARFTLMTTRYYLKDGKRMPSVSYVDVEAWGYSAQILRECGKPGQRVRITGSLSQDRWEDGGGKRGRLKVVADRIAVPFVDPPPKKEPTPAAVPTQAEGERVPAEADLSREEAAARMHQVLATLAQRRHFHPAGSQPGVAGQQRVG